MPDRLDPSLRPVVLLIAKALHQFYREWSLYQQHSVREDGRACDLYEQFEFEELPNHMQEQYRDRARRILAQLLAEL